MAPLILSLLLLAPAQETPAETAWRACVDRTTTNYDWGQCGGDYVRAADAALNAEWKKLMAVVDGETKADLIAEEKAWIAYRDGACRFYHNGNWGREAEVLHYPGCVAGVIEQRTEQLADYREFVDPK